MTNIKDYLINKQPIVYKTLVNAFSANKQSHAYLISGAKGSPILDVAKFMAASFVCNHKIDGLACGVCKECLNIISNNYVDVVVFNGANMKVDDIKSLQEEFSMTSLTNTNYRVYIINEVEKCGLLILNKLLKFLEEPQDNVKAILTTNSIQLVLPTIVSRCQNIALKDFSINDLASYLVTNGVEAEDAYLIASISNDAESDLDLVNSDEYASCKDALINTLRYMASNDQYLFVYMQSEGLKMIEDNPELYCDMLSSALLEAIKIKEIGETAPFENDNLTKISKNIKNIEEKIDAINEAKNALIANTNKNLVFDRLLVKLIRR